MRVVRLLGASSGNWHGTLATRSLNGTAVEGFGYPSASHRRPGKLPRKQTEEEGGGGGGRGDKGIQIGHRT